MDLQLFLGLIGMGGCWLIFAIPGAWMLFFTHRVIDGTVRIAKKISVYDADKFPDPHSEMNVFGFRLLGLGFMLLPAVPLIVVIQGCILHECNIQ